MIVAVIELKMSIHSQDIKAYEIQFKNDLFSNLLNIIINNTY